MSDGVATATWRPGWYLSRVTTNEFENATWLVVHLLDDLKPMVEDARTALLDLKQRHGGWGNITMRGGISLHVLDYFDEELTPQIFPDIQLPEGEEVVYLGEHFNAAVIPDKIYWRSECQGLHITEDSIYAVAHGKYNDASVESQDISEFFQE